MSLQYLAPQPYNSDIILPEDDGSSFLQALIGGAISDFFEGINKLLEEAAKEAKKKTPSAPAPKAPEVRQLAPLFREFEFYERELNSDSLRLFRGFEQKIHGEYLYKDFIQPNGEKQERLYESEQDGHMTPFRK